MSRARRLAVVLALLVLRAVAVRATCNVIPGVARTFRATLADVDRPFARPGDWVGLTVSGPCAGGSPGLGEDVRDHVVTVVFTPPLGAPRHVVVIATDCARLARDRQACAARPDVAAVVCVESTAQDPQLDLVTPEDVDRKLRVRFPDTDALVDGPSDDRTLAGPATLAVSRPGDPLPCRLAAESCAQQSGLLACVDDLFAPNGSCDTTPGETFAHFTALPPPNDYQAVCADPASICTGTATEVRFTTDTEGNVLLPVDWSGVLLGEGVPIARLLRGATSVPAFPGQSGPVRVPGASFLGSFTIEGGRLPPIFVPQVDPMARDSLALFGTADAPAGVLRIARRSSTRQVCAGGEHNGLPCSDPIECPGGTCDPSACAGGEQAGSACTSDADCPGGECGPGLFEFRSRFRSGIGPVVVSRLGPGTCQGGSRAGAPCAVNDDCPASLCVAYHAVAADPVPLDSLIETPALFAFVVPEAIAARDLNGDGDARDDAILLADHTTGAVRAVGTTAPGRAVVRVHQPPFSFPAVVAEDDVVAFLESEPAEGARDTNRNGQVFESILRAFRLQADAASELTGGQTLVADAAPRVNHRSLVLSRGRVFFRTPEAATSPQTTTLALASPYLGVAFGPYAVTPEGRFIAYGSSGGTVCSGGSCTVFPAPGTVAVRDRTTGEDTVVYGAEDHTAASPALSSDGRRVAFTAVGDGVYQVLLADAGTPGSILLSAGPGGEPGDKNSLEPAISADGRVIAFRSGATNLTDGDTNGADDLFVYDAAVARPTLTRMTLGPGGEQGDGDSTDPSISADGRFIAFASRAGNLVADDTNHLLDVFLLDRATGRTTRVSVGSHGEQANASSFYPSISADGDHVVFGSVASNLVPGDTNGALDVFVHDRTSGQTSRVSVRSDGGQVTPKTFQIGRGLGGLSPDGRWVAFSGDATDLVPLDNNGLGDIFLHDRITAATVRVNLGPDGAQANGVSYFPVVGPDAREIYFESTSSDLVRSHQSGIFVRGPEDPARSDTVLRVFDAATRAIVDLGPAREAVVAGAAAAFLAPADSGTSVRLWRGQGEAEDLGRSGAALALSEELLAALVDRTPDGTPQAPMLEVHPVAQPAGSWHAVGEAADLVEVSHGLVAFVTPEHVRGIDLNGDGDTADRVLQLYDATADTVTNLGWAVQEFVLGDGLIAFRTREAEQGQDLNEDGDRADDVLIVYDLGEHRVFNTGQAVIPCPLEACDPRVPYRVAQSTVTFLTLEADQGRDLNDDDDRTDLVLQLFNVAAAKASAARPQARARALVTGERVAARTVRAVAAVSAGICTNTGAACAIDAACPTGGTCFVPPGGCVRDLGRACGVGDPGTCAPGEFCEPVADAPGRATCRVVDGPCASDADCRAPATCRAAAQSVQRLVDPLSTSASAAQLFAGSGRCVDAAGEDRGACDAGSGCPPASACRQDLAIRAGSDLDRDEIPDALDDCPQIYDPAQLDADGDGIGDACAAGCRRGPGACLAGMLCVVAERLVLPDCTAPKARRPEKLWSRARILLERAKSVSAERPRQGKHLVQKAVRTLRRALGMARRRHGACPTVVTRLRDALELARTVLHDASCPMNASPRRSKRGPA